MNEKIGCLVLIFVFIVMLFAADAVFAIKLDEQIKQNVDAAQKSYEQIINKEPPRLWIHVRTEEQRELVQNIANWLKPISLIQIQPVQVVKEGPKQTKLRFFASQDKDAAGELLTKLKKVFPQLELQDLSAQYGAMNWMEAGHFELWLAPDLKKIELPPPPPVVSPTTVTPPLVAPAPVAPSTRFRGRRVSR